MSLWKAFSFLSGVALGLAPIPVHPGQEAPGPDAPPAAIALAESQQPPEPVPETPAAPKPGARPARPAPEARPAPRAQPAPDAPPAPSRGSRGEHVNVRVDLKIRAQKGSRPPVEKTLALVTVGDNSRTAIRTKSSVPFNVGPKSNEGIQYQSLSLNADARVLVEGSRVAADLTLEYEFATQAHEGEVEGRAAGTVTSSVQNAIRALLEDGKPLVVSDQVDAATDYRVTVEAKATILR
jgi:hypothetical protein